MATDEAGTGTTASADDPLKPANELIRAAARWLIGALGAIGALLVAGSQLSSIGSLDASASRLRWAVLGLAVALTAILLAIWRMTSLLLPRAMEIDVIAADWEKARPGPAGLPWWRRWRYPAVHYLASHRQYLGGGDDRTVPQINDQWWKEGYDEDELGPLRGLIERVESIAAHETLLASFRRARWWISALVVVAAAGIGAFAWAANPGADISPDLRNVDLSGADLTGAALRKADLTGADLTGADLTGAHLDGAVIEGVTWKHTTCPDGTDSDDIAKPDGTGGTCAGHLEP
jgi:hypothetical protein